MENNNELSAIQEELSAIRKELKESKAKQNQTQYLILLLFVVLMVSITQERTYVILMALLTIAGLIYLGYSLFKNIGEASAKDAAKPA